MTIIEKSKECAGTVKCRFKVVLQVSIALTLLAILGVIYFAPTVTP